ncbi:MAG: hypothetical protein JST04_15590 [Bdellovibrionales bacterium]|nr:hypothetical protein [Bdellovibrionales bacterium]
MSKREREYTPEEAYALTLREATPHWYGSPPLVVGVDLHDRVYPQPLDASIQKGIWVFFFVSATGAEFPRVREIYRLWLKRFRPLGVRFVFSFRAHYPFFGERRVIEAWISSLGFGTPAVCDVNGALARAFGANGEPGVAILTDGKIRFVDAGPQSTETAEGELHEALRVQSPGLPLWPVTRESGELLHSTDRWPLRENAKAILGRQVELVGRWEFDENRIVTSDPKAEIHFTAPASAVAIVARSLSDAGDPTRIRFDAEGASFSDTFAGGDFQVDDEGNSSLVLGGPRAYFALKGLSPMLRKLRFRFPFAKVSPVGVYGFEFGDPAKSG